MNVLLKQESSPRVEVGTPRRRRAHLKIARPPEPQYDPYARLEELEHRALEGGGAVRVERQHREGKLTARERIELLVDSGTFVEMDRFVTHQCHDFGMEKKRIPGDGVITGYGNVNGRQVFVFAQDFTVFGGTLSSTFASKICKIMDLAARVGAPIIGLNDSGGGRVQEGVMAMAGYSDVFVRNMLCSGVVPQISAIMGPCAGGAAYSPSITDFIFMVEGTSHMFLTGPDVIKAVNHEEATKEELGGANTHATQTGLAHFVCPDDAAALEGIRTLLSYLPQNNMEDPPRVETSDPQSRVGEALDELVPRDSRLTYDVRHLLETVVDDGTFFEVQEHYAPNLIVGFARLGGRSVGIVANQPMCLAGCLDIDASLKGARFVRFCDCFNIPIVTLVDTPGFLPGIHQELGGIVKHGAKLLYAYAEATVPKVAVIARKAYGGAYAVLASKQVRTDIAYAYPHAEIAVMGAEGAVDFIYKEALATAPDQEAARAGFVEEYRRTFANPFKAAELGYVDEVIRPRDTRPRLISALRMLENKRLENPVRKHGNMPL